jgi:hypothetical protein
MTASGGLSHAERQPALAINKMARSIPLAIKIKIFSMLVQPVKKNHRLGEATTL